MTRREWTSIGVVMLAALAVLILLRSPLGLVEDQITRLRYGVRGSGKADTNIVVIYIDQGALRSLHWPVRRNFYGLMLKALSDLHVRAVGIEAFFEDQNPEYPEYDDLLTRMCALSGNVVLTSYFDAVVPQGPAPGRDSLPAGMFDYPAVLEDVPSGSRPHMPFAPLRGSSAGIGHVNLGDNCRIDLFLGDGEARVPAFGLEVARVYYGAARSGVVCRGSTIQFRREAATTSIATTTAGSVTVNIPGKMGSFTAYPFMEVLRAYDALRTERSPALPVASLHGKIALIGLIAEGRSVFVPTPADPRLPAILLHASLIDNMLEDRFIVVTPFWITVLVSLFAGLLSAAAAVMLRSPWNRWALVCLPLLLITISMGLFLASAVIFPLGSAAGLFDGRANEDARLRRAEKRLR